MDNAVVIIKFLNTTGINCDNLKDIEGMIIPREILLDNNKYIAAKNNIPILKKIFSSSYLTSLQNSAYETQKWPLLNLVRQILKTNDYKMTPKRKSNGYDEDGKKKYLRFFLVEKINTEEIKDISASIVE